MGPDLDSLILISLFFSQFSFLLFVFSFLFSFVFSFPLFCFFFSPSKILKGPRQYHNHCSPLVGRKRTLADAVTNSLLCCLTKLESILFEFWTFLCSELALNK